MDDPPPIIDILRRITCRAFNAANPQCDQTDFGRKRARKARIWTLLCFSGPEFGRGGDVRGLDAMKPAPGTHKESKPTTMHLNPTRRHLSPHPSTRAPHARRWRRIKQCSAIKDIAARLDGLHKPVDIISSEPRQSVWIATCKGTARHWAGAGELLT